MIAGRVGGAVSAELGSMRVTEQLDALRGAAQKRCAEIVLEAFQCGAQCRLLAVQLERRRADAAGAHDLVEDAKQVPVDMAGKARMVGFAFGHGWP